MGISGKKPPRSKGTEGSKNSIRLARRKSDELYRRLAESSADFIFVIGRDFRVKYVNVSGAAALGMGPENVEGKRLGELFPPDTVEEMAKGLSRVFESGQPYSAEMTHNISRGDIHIHVSLNPIIAEDGKVDSVAGTSRDITGLKKAERALLDSEEKYRALYDNAGTAIVIVDPGTGAVLDCNSKAEKMFGRPHDELIRMAVTQLHPPEGADASSHAIVRQARQGSVVNCETEALHKDGRRIPVIINITPIVINGKKVVMGFFLDISERKQAEEALRKSEASLVKSQEMAHIGSWEMEVAKGDEINRSAESYRVFGERPGGPRIDYPDFLAFIVPRDRKRVDRIIRSTLETGVPYTATYDILRRDGEIRTLMCHGEVERDAEGRIVRMFGTNQDVTESKRAEESLKEAKAQAELYLDLMGHDINNMNHVSMGFMELIRDGLARGDKVDADTLGLLDKAIISLANSSKLIDNVRKIQREKMGLYAPETLDLGETVEDVCKQFRDVPNRDVKINCGAFKGTKVQANELLKDVFINLIGNAIKHSKGPLLVDVRMDTIQANGAKYYEVLVEDNGPGIPDAMKKTLFEHLGLAETRARGKGFGLCLTKTLVDDYNGEFRVEDRVPGDHTKGARFVVTLPAVE